MRAQLAISAFTETVLANLEYLEENIEVLDNDLKQVLSKRQEKLKSI